MRSDVLNPNSGGYSLSEGGLIKVLKQTVDFTADSATIASGAISLPNDAVIVRLTAVASTALAFASATLGIRCGTAAAGVQLIADDDNGLETSATALAAGLGCSTYAELNTALSAPAAHVIVASAAYQTAGTEVHFTVTASTGAFTAGAMTFIVEYIPLNDNVG